MIKLWWHLRLEWYLYVHRYKSTRLRLESYREDGYNPKSAALAYLNSLPRR